MYHSITFGEDNPKNTYTDWHLIPKSRPYFAPPGVKTKYLLIPGGNRRLDYTETLLGRPAFDNRQGSLEFVVEDDETFNWNVIYERILEYLHGKTMKAVLEDDPEYYYEGVFKVTERKSEKYYPSIVIEYSLYPYKRKIVPTELNFNVIDVVCTEVADFYGGVNPEFDCSSDEGIEILVTKKPHDFKTSEEVREYYKSHPDEISDSFTISGSVNNLKYFKMRGNGSNLILMGSGTITMRYRGGSL